MRFWDSSALVPLLLLEPASGTARDRYLEDPEVAVAWTTAIECASPIARLEREGHLGPRETAQAFARLDGLAATWNVVEPRDETLEVARRLLRVHPLRAADALQLAAAFLAAERRPATLAFVTRDERLRAAAEREGFEVIAL